jgi:hypothetical protein
LTFFAKTLSGSFTIPSGIVSTATPIIQYIFDHMPEVGVGNFVALLAKVDATILRSDLQFELIARL